jgi:hypothetical protein
MFPALSRAGLGRISLAAAVLALVALGATAGAARAGTPSVYTDASGDNASAPDIQRIVMTDNGDGTVGVEIDLAAAVPDDGGSDVVLGIDADRNAQTGEPHTGFEYLVVVTASGVGIGKWDGSNWSAFNHQSLSPNAVGGRVTFTLTLADIGATEFDFVVVSVHGNDSDGAPENGVFTYPQTVATPQIQSIMLPLGALVPKAGKTLAVPSLQVKLSTNQVVSADSVTCTLSYRGKAIHPVGTCAWKLPKADKKKRLALTITATYQGATATMTVPVIPR